MIMLSQIRRIAVQTAGILLLLLVTAPLFGQRPIYVPGNAQSTAFDDGQTGAISTLFRKNLALEATIRDATVRSKISEFPDPWPDFIEQLDKNRDVVKARAFDCYLGFGFFMLGQFADAAEANRAAIAAGPYAPATYNLVLDEIKLEAFDEARHALKSGFEAGGFRAEDLVTLLGLIDDAEKAKKLAGEGLAAYKKGDFEQAASDFGQAAKLQPENGSVAYEMGLTSLRIGMPDMAVQAFNLAAVYLPLKNPAAHIELVEAYCALKKVDDVEREMKVALRLAPNSLYARFAHANCMQDLGKWDVAKKEWKETLDLNPDNPEVLNSYGYALADHGEDLSHASEMIQRALKADPDNPGYLDSFAWAQYKMRAYVAAKASIVAAMKLDAANPTIEEHMGDILMKNDRPDVAKAGWMMAKKLSYDVVQKDRLTKKIATVADVKAWDPDK